MAEGDGRWHIFVDRGGTFTDLVAVDPAGRLRVAKLLSADPRHYRDATVEGVRRLLGLTAGEPLPADEIAEIRIGTTVATNALLERKGARTALVTTEGFRDAIWLGRTHRPDLFALKICRPAPLYTAVIEVRERIAADGTVVAPLDEPALIRGLSALKKQGITSIAIVFVHGARFPAHERRAAELARAMGFAEVVTSHEAAPVTGFWSRGQTTVADAYLTPVLHDYVAGLARNLAGVPLTFMQSSGGRIAAAGFRGRNAVLSGPAGGVVGAVEAAGAHGFSRIIGFDMGGTSTDVSRYDGRHRLSDRKELEGITFRVPMVAVDTVAAGGGSICSFDGERLRVGPQSAGAEPGPACYGKGGPLTVTDCNLLLGRLLPAYFPHVFGPQADAPLDPEASRRRLAEIRERIAATQTTVLTPEDLAEGFLDIAVERMARAIKRITLEEGADPREYVLVAFGGAGGQLACRVAEALEIGRVLVHPLAGVLSALGIGASGLESRRLKGLDLPLDEAGLARLHAVAAEEARALTEHIRQAAAKAGLATERLEAEVSYRLHLRYADADSTIEVDWRGPDAGEGSIRPLQQAFADLHRRMFGYVDERRRIVMSGLVCEVRLREPLPALVLPRPSGSGRPAAASRIYARGRWVKAAVYRRDDLRAGQTIEGAAVVADDTQTVVIEPGWQAQVMEDGCLLLTCRHRGHRLAATAAERADPAMLERFHNFFMAIAESMGAVLEATAASVNMKERLDFSCAVFDGRGALVANAPHMPVHLGSMGLTVQEMIRRFAGIWRPGDAVVTNDPAAGGTHLPDVTVVMPVFLKEEDPDPAYFVAARGHHADIGGISPGSMPPDSTRLEEEGVVIPPRFLLRQGCFLEEEMAALLREAPWPARDIARNLADLKAQLAAVERGRQELLALVDRHGRSMVDAYMGHIHDNAARAVRRLLARLRSGHVRYEMDCGAVLDVRIAVMPEAQRAIFDLSGSSDQHPGNFNAPRAVSRAAVLYVLRCLVGEDIPLNDGCLIPVEIRLRSGSILDPAAGAAVVAGNVETSQALTNALLMATEAEAASQGTMNNLSFGNDRYQYYETICGGTGAGPDFDGADAVQSHMTNSRLTDVEVLEARYPVRVEQFGIRSGSGGSGRYRGGNGALRRFLFLEEMEARILSSHRKAGPPGLAGGRPGLRGINRVIRRDGRVEQLEGADGRRLGPGDRLEIATPGGGGYGPG
ncbi:MAG: 5-oxoprolinase [Alphaproteobacteria bacterium]|nr:MAG: 5-oxoprolinase [Alphaproteobacteria bacterium]